MAENRGNHSGSNTEIINGVTKNRKPKMNNDDTNLKTMTNTLKNMNIVMGKFTDFVMDNFGSTKGFEKVITKSTNDLINFQDKKTKEEKKHLETLKKITDKFGDTSKEVELYKKQYNNELKEMKEEENKLALDIKKNFIKQSFKNETEQNEIKFMSNKYAKNTNLVSTSNEYHNQLEKLKSDALDTYGEDFINNKEYKKALMNLNDEYGKNMIDAWKEDFKENHKVLSGIASGIKDTFDRNKETLQGLLGPLNLFIAPLKDFFGGFGAVFKFIGGGVKKLFGKFIKKNPTASDVLKSGAFGVGALYIGNILQKQFGKTKGEGGGLSSLKDKLLEPLEGMKEIFGKNSNFMQNARILSGMGGGLMVVADFISEFQKTGDWRGALSKGLTGSSMIENVVKGALLGFSIGGPIGAIVGALAGGTLNYFSPEIEKFIRTLTGDKSQMKKNMLENLEKDVKKGKRSQKELDIWNKLASNMTDTDFASLGAVDFESLGSQRADWVKRFAEGKISLTDDELYFMAPYFMDKTAEITKSVGMDNFRNLLNVLGGINEFDLGEILKNENSLAKNLKSFMILQSTKGYDKEKLAEFLKINKLTEEEYRDFIKKEIPNLTDSDIETINSVLNIIDPKNKQKSKFKSVDDAIIRTDGSVIKTNPKDTLVALKDIPLSMEQVRNNTTKNLNSSLGSLSEDKNLEKKLTTIIDVLSKILAKDVQVNLPPQTRNDLDMIMSGGMI